jgi:signal transduction histidine kinase/HPt (histidine-containing phosphotransfer) domain-containing protein/ActR/RegA family two-component response regulator
MLGFEDENDFPNVQGSWSNRLHPDDKDRVIKAIDAHLQDKTGKIDLNVEYQMMKKDGTYAYYQTMGTTVRDEFGKPARVVGSQQDITHRRKLLDETESKYREAEEANRAKSTFLSTISHEIRTPMNAILGIAEIELMNDSHCNTARAVFEKIWSSGDMLMSIINDILDFSKIEAGKLDIINDKYGVASLINDTVQLNIMRIGSKEIIFELQVDENIPEYLIGDGLRVKQILNNLLSNAFKYTQEGKVALNVYAEENKNTDDEIIIIFEISDTGLGMSEDQVERLFDEYTRFNEKTNRFTEGTGLGMSIANNLVTLMNGSISVKSKIGEGTHFTIRLPQKKNGSDVLGHEVAENLKLFRTNGRAQLERAQMSREPMPYGSVLIIDDVDVNIYVARGLLTPYRLNIDSADNGFTAIEKVEKGNVYDIIFMDHMMPQMDGVETTKKLRALGYTSPIVALTANAVVGQVDFFIENGFTDFISKPIDIRQLNMVLNKYIRDKQPPEVLEEARRLNDIQISNNIDKGRLSGVYINGINIDEALEQFGNAEAYIEILNVYAINTRKLLAKIKNVTKNDLEAYEITIHSLKGSSRSIYAKALGAMAADLESATILGDMDYINQHNPLFIKSANDLLIELDAFFAELDSKIDKQKKDKPDIKLLQKLQEACECFDIEEVEMYMKEIKSFQYDSDDGLVAWLYENVELMNYDEVAQKIAKII